jgi:hypothetical protein
LGEVGIFQPVDIFEIIVLSREQVHPVPVFSWEGMTNGHRHPLAVTIDSTLYTAPTKKHVAGMIHNVLLPLRTAGVAPPRAVAKTADVIPTIPKRG